MVKQYAELTFKDNLKRGRHGWVRLTPAYSVKIVQDILAEHPSYQHVLDPFSGTGTTALAAAQSGIQASLVDINPFLIWLASVKTAIYTKDVLPQTQEVAFDIVEQSRQKMDTTDYWIPPISNIERWWSQDRLQTLATLYHHIQHLNAPIAIHNLLLIAFCRLLIDWSNAAFNHQSMSFKASTISLFDDHDMMLNAFLDNIQWVVQGASDNPIASINLYQADSRQLDIEVPELFDCVITSPPYSNRMSYIRELRPYMYWLGYLEEARDAGELDWQAIGGTWGIATSRLNTWESQNRFESKRLTKIVQSIASESETLANYVHKYMDDMYQHFTNLKKLLTDDADIYYIVGNSKFYDTLVPVEQLYQDMLDEIGFTHINIQKIRKRNSKKELYEFLVTANNSPKLLA